MHKNRAKHTFKVFTDSEIYDALLKTRSVESVIASMDQKQRRLKMLTRNIPTETDICINFAKDVVGKLRY